MQITDVRVRLCGNNSEQLRAFCSITLDGDFVIRDLKVIEGTSGLFVAMPSRKLSDRCPKCRHKNHLRARFCNDCGAKLRDGRAPRNNGGRSKLYVDVAHPINTDCRRSIQERVVNAYLEETDRSNEPGYVPQPYDDSGDDCTEGSEYEELIRELRNDAEARRRSPRPQRDTRRPDPIVATVEEASDEWPDELVEATEQQRDADSEVTVAAAASTPHPVAQNNHPVQQEEDDDEGFGDGIL